jgi:hypothetical protein
MGLVADMETIHRISVNSIDIKFVTYIKELEINYKTQKLPGRGNELYFFDIYESDPRWNTIFKMIKTYGASDVYQTIFSTDEIKNAEWSRIIPVCQGDYPYPKESWLQKHPNYEIFCPQCGTYIQKESFWIEKEPSLKGNDFFSLFWVYILFGSQNVFQELEVKSIRGYEGWNLMVKKMERASKILKQIYVSNTTLPGLIVNDLYQYYCNYCKTTKYSPHQRGKMLINHDAIIPGLDIIQTYEWFGSGHAAYREILVSNRFANLILDRGWKGVSLKVVELV